MKRFSTLIALFSVSTSALLATPPPITPRTVIAKVDSYEHYRSFRGSRFSQQTPYGNEATIVAKITYPASLAGREIAIPFESQNERNELLVQPGTMFRFEHPINVADLREKTDWVRRRAIGFPELGIQIIDAKGEVLVSYDGALTRLDAAKEKKAKKAP